MTVLASGSKGNSSVISTARTRILVDAGLSCRELMRRMKLAGEDPHALNAVIITHEHADHVSGLSVLARRLNIPVYFTQATHQAWVRQMTPRTVLGYKLWLEKTRREKEERLEAQALAHQIATLAATATDPFPADHFFATGPGSSSSNAANASTSHPGSGAFNSTTASNSLDSATASNMVSLTKSRTVSMDASMSGELPDAIADPAGLLESAALEDALEPDVEISNENPPESLQKAKKRASYPDKNASFLPAVEYFEVGKDLSIGDIDIHPFTIPHDAADPCGFVFQAEGLRFGFATDLGYIPHNVKLALKRCDVLLLESNHDLEMLRDGPYPWSVKQRVLSRVGHLSNDSAAEFLTRDYDGGAHSVVLAHLSESNNQPELARFAAEQALGNRLSLLGNHLLLARQDAPLDPICL